MNSPEYRRFVTGQRCLVAEVTVHGRTCEGPIDPHHIRKGSGAGGGQKPGDEVVCGFCHAHHVEYHNVGHDSFNARYDLDDEHYLLQQRRMLAAFIELVLSRLTRALAREKSRGRRTAE